MAAWGGALAALTPQRLSQLHSFSFESQIPVAKALAPICPNPHRYPVE